MKKETRPDPFLEFFSSTRLTIILLIALGVFSIIGTVVIQKGTEEELHIPQVYSAVTIRAFETLGFFDIYHSGLYMGVLLLLSANLVVCTIRRLPIDLARRKNMLRVPIPRHIEKMPGLQKLEWRRDRGDPGATVERVLSKEGYCIRKGDGAYWVASKGELGRFGFYITHLGFLIILAGGLISGLISVEGMLWLVPNEEVSVFTTYQNQEIPLNFKVKCNSFDISRYENGMVKEYRSHLQVTLKDGVKKQETLIVNHPLSYEGFRLYQASYQSFGAASGEFTMRLDDGLQQDFTLAFPGEYRIKDMSGRDVIIRCEAFEPDFVRDEKGQPGTRSMDLNNPAALLTVAMPDKEAVSLWLFLRFPEFHGTPADAGFELQFKDVNAAFATGIQVSNDPGSPLIWIGSIVMIIGLVVSFFVSPHRIWVVIETAASEKKLLIAGSTNRKYVNLEPVLSDIKRRLEYAGIPADREKV